MQQELISIIIPTYREEGNVPVITERLHNILQNENYEIVFINDGSPDNTLEKIKNEAIKSRRIRYVSFSRNFGHQAALRAGLAQAKGDAIISIDADMQHPVELIPQLIAKWKEGNDIVYTIRKSDFSKVSILKRCTSNLFYNLINKLSDVDIDPGAADFRLINKKVQKVILDLNESDIFFRGIFPWIGFKQAKIEYQANPRTWGETNYTFKKMISLAISGITSFSTKPLIFSIYIGLFSSLLAFTYGTYAFYQKFFSNGTVDGWTSIILCIILLGGLQLICLGVIGQYIAKIYQEVRKRPSFIISESSE